MLILIGILVGLTVTFYQREEPNVIEADESTTTLLCNDIYIEISSKKEKIVSLFFPINPAEGRYIEDLSENDQMFFEDRIFIRQNYLAWWQFIDRTTLGFYETEDERIGVCKIVDRRAMMEEKKKYDKKAEIYKRKAEEAKKKRKI